MLICSASGTLSLNSSRPQTDNVQNSRLTRSAANASKRSSMTVNFSRTFTAKNVNNVVTQRSVLIRRRSSCCLFESANVRRTANTRRRRSANVAEPLRGPCAKRMGRNFETGQRTRLIAARVRSTSSGKRRRRRGATLYGWEWMGVARSLLYTFPFAVPLLRLRRRRRRQPAHPVDRRARRERSAGVH